MIGCMFVLVVSMATTMGLPAEECRATGEKYFLSDERQCDRFHMCDEEGQISAEFLCEDGLVFDPISGQCAQPININCPQPLELQEPQPIGGCQRLNGKWAVEDTCNQYTECQSGEERLVTCQNHLVYDEISGQCEHPDVANRLGCTAEELYGFSCPSVVGQTRFGAESDCRAFFTCAVFTNYHPRLGGCPVGTVFNDEKQICDAPENVPRCENYYKDEEV